MINITEKKFVTLNEFKELKQRVINIENRLEYFAKKLKRAGGTIGTPNAEVEDLIYG